LYGYETGELIGDSGDGDDVVPATYEVGVPVAIPAVVRVQTAPGAKLWFDGVATSQSGELRTFSTPALEAGRTYAYKVRACWLQKGKPVLRAETIEVTPGTTTVVDLR
jgi:uncharacterized protein (TIGR03000 family)